MIEIKKIMDYLYSQLTQFAPVHFEEIDRNEDGSITINETNIVYNFEGMYQLSNAKCRRDIPLYIDIWYLMKDIYTIEDIIYNMDNILTDVIVNTDTAGAFKIIKSNNFLINIPNDNKRINDKNINREIRRKRLNYVIKYYRV